MLYLTAEVLLVIDGEAFPLDSLSINYSLPDNIGMSLVEIVGRVDLKRGRRYKVEKQRFEKSSPNDGSQATRKFRLVEEED